MPIIKSARKRVRVAHRASVRNSKTKRSLKAALKSLSAKPSTKTHASAQSKIDTAVKKGVISRNKAARLKSRAAAKAKTANVKFSGAGKTVAAKKGTTKKTAVKSSTRSKKS